MRFTAIRTSALVDPLASWLPVGATSSTLASRLDNMLVAQNILVDALDAMRSQLEDEHVLRYCAELLRSLRNKADLSDVLGVRIERSVLI
jgi:hypothetical protein